MNIEWWSAKRAGEEFVTQRVLVVGHYVAVSLGSGISPGDLWKDARATIEKHGWRWIRDSFAWISDQPPGDPVDDDLPPALEHPANKMAREAMRSDRESQIRAECQNIADLLVEKNRAYGDSALNPVRIMSKADSVEQIKVRLDDKLSRLARGSEAGEDVILDLIGYLVLLRIAKKESR